MSKANKNNAGYLQPAFLICAAVLALVGGGMSVARKRLGLYLEKRPLPLKRPLDLFDETALAPYAVIEKLAIENEDILQSLGTSDYIQWVLEDPREPGDSPVRRVMLFITYYPLPDQVPHVPEECYTGGGYRRAGTEDVRLSVGGPEGDGKVPARHLVFEASGTPLPLGAGRFPVLYLFRVNGEYAGSRDRARIALNRNIFSPYAYFCKVELVFNQTHAAPTNAQAMAAGERLLRLVLPVLEKEHWPDGVQP